MEISVKFESDGLQLAGILHVPDDLKKGEQRPAMDPSLPIADFTAAFGIPRNSPQKRICWSSMGASVPLAKLL